LPKLPALPRLPALPEPLRTYGPVLVALLYMLPRVVNAHFGLLDDAVTLSVAKVVVKQPSYSLHAYASAGRFLPGYWLYWTFWYAIAGLRPAFFYAGQAGLLALAVWAMTRILRQFETGAAAIWAAAGFFIFSAPAAEAYFTLSKGEPVALGCCLVSILAAHRASRSARPVPYWTLAGVLALVAFTTRETAIAFGGVVGIWWLLSFWRGFGKPCWLSRKALAIYLGVMLAGAAPVFLGRFLLRESLAAGSYAARYRLTWATLSQSARVWSYSLARNFPALVVLAICGAILAWRRRARGSALWGALWARQTQLLLLMAVWMAASAAILMPWPQADPYYELPFAAAASMFCGVITGELVRLAGKRRWWAGAALGMVALLGLIAAVNGVNLARYQIMVDEENARLLEALARLPRNSAVSINLPSGHEYFNEIGLHLKNLLGRPDLRIAPMDFGDPAVDGPELPHYAVSIDSANQRWPLVRGPIPEATAAEWNRCWRDWSGGVHRAAPAAKIGRTWQMVDIGLETLWCKLAAGGLDRNLSNVVCQSRPLLDLRQASYGWTIDPYPRGNLPRAASFAAGVWTIEQPSGALAKLPLGIPGDVPVAADWDGDGPARAGDLPPFHQTLADRCEPGGKGGAQFFSSRHDRRRCARGRRLGGRA